MGHDKPRLMGVASHRSFIQFDIKINCDIEYLLTLTSPFLEWLVVNGLDSIARRPVRELPFLIRTISMISQMETRHSWRGVLHMAIQGGFKPPVFLV